MPVEVREKQIFNLMDTNGRRRDVLNALRIYLEHFLERKITGWPVNVLTPEVNRENVLAALREGPYGRCVYECDNDVIDNQVVNVRLEAFNADNTALVGTILS